MPLAWACSLILKHKIKFVCHFLHGNPASDGQPSNSFEAL